MNGRKRQRRRRPGFGWLAAALVVVFWAALAHASGTGHEGAEHAARFDKAMVFQIINFILLVCLLVWAYRKSSEGSGGFAGRSREVREAMEEAAAAKRKAEEKYLEYQARISALDGEIKEILDKAGEDAEREREAILEEARRQSERMIAQAELTAKQEVEAAKLELRKEAADLTVRLATEILEKSMTPDDHRSWIRSYIEKIGDLQ